MKEDMHEINHYRDRRFPVEIYRVNHSGIVPAGRGLLDYHWHEELQFTLVTRGTVIMQVNGELYTLSAGEALYIGSGMIHAAVKLSEDGEYASLNFPYRLLGFFSGSRMNQQDVLPYAVGGRLPAIILRQDVHWMKKVLLLIQEVNLLFLNNQVRGREYEISVHLVQIWLFLIQNCGLEKTEAYPPNLLRQERAQTILTYLYEHYAEDIALADLANAAHVSVGECCRTFRDCLGTTPHRFLKEYRVRKSTELLFAGASVSETAGLCGFNQVSNFIQAFKSIMGCTPLKFAESSRSEQLPDFQR